MEEEFQLLTTTRYDPTLTNLRWNDDLDGPSPYFLLPYHYERLKDAVKRHGWDLWGAYAYQHFKYAVVDTVSKQLVGKSEDPPALRIRILLHRNGETQITAMPLEATFNDDPFLYARRADVDEVRQQSHSPINIYVDKEPTGPSLFTVTKTTARRVYEEARQRNNLSPLTTLAGRSQEVLLHNHGGLIMETSIFNIACKRGGRWITPSSTSGCLPGVARHWLLENGRIVEDADCALTVANIKTGELVLLFNGVQGCRLGVIHDAD